MKKSDQIKQIDQQIEALRNTLSVTADAILLLKSLKADLTGTKGKKKAPINLPHKAAEVPTLEPEENNTVIADGTVGMTRGQFIPDPDFPKNSNLLSLDEVADRITGKGLTITTRDGTTRAWPFPRKP